MAEARCQIAVYCGASPGADPCYQQLAATLGRALAERGLGLVYGGGRVGLMGALADAALAAGGQVVGVITQSLLQREVGHAGLSELRVVASMHQRKASMADLADAFIALPGGFGTLDELCEVITWAQLGLHDKPIALLDSKGYFDGLLGFVEHAKEQGFIRQHHSRQLQRYTHVDSVLDAIEAAISSPPPAASVPDWR